MEVRGSALIINDLFKSLKGFITFCLWCWLDWSSLSFEKCSRGTSRRLPSPWTQITLNIWICLMAWPVPQKHSSQQSIRFSIKWSSFSSYLSPQGSSTLTHLVTCYLRGIHHVQMSINHSTSSLQSTSSWCKLNVWMFSRWIFSSHCPSWWNWIYDVGVGVVLSQTQVSPHHLRSCLLWKLKWVTGSSLLLSCPSRSSVIGWEETFTLSSCRPTIRTWRRA